MTVNLLRELSSLCNCILSSSVVADDIFLLRDSSISCNALSTSLLKNLAIKVTLSLLVLGSKSKSTLACSSMEETLGVSNEEDNASSSISVTSALLSLNLKSLSSFAVGYSSIDLLFSFCHKATRPFTDSSVSPCNFLAKSLISLVVTKQLFI